jgi:hypothetical protein
MTERLRRRLFDDIENCGTDLSCGYFIAIIVIMNLYLASQAL